MTTVPSLVIGIATTATERRQLAQLLGGTETFLIVSSAHQARRFLDLVRRPGNRAPVTPTAAPTTTTDGPVLAGAEPERSPTDAAPAAAPTTTTDGPVLAGAEPERSPTDAAPVDADAAPVDVDAVPVDAGVVPVGAGVVRVDAGAVPVRAGRGRLVDDVAAGLAGPSAPELAVDSDRRVLRWREREVGLTPLEHDLLVCLNGTPGQVWTYARLHRTVWGNDHLGRRSDMHSVVRRLRHKLGRLDAAATIHAVRGVGFRLAPSS
ncbi:winged helix-turn-helix domain-containing protein [Micromonospora sp. WMMC241]|uniref:winged helix-turn-helix domain-containing protein n=1 Tax=Micromonospora sp. WMMC241 TaxID=3015159 RepID=UPI0022B6B4A3|nr:winged helix-turn-helix domain-containing protein [Micromonospora sp. WMMC241]MCZ7438691.1 winged helix-turn-helix domain-containing protein [Micromonospora sp. WMMC241]